MHGLVAKKAKLRRPLTFEIGPRYQDHAKMNAHILGNAMAVERWNDQKVVNCACTKGQYEWDKLVIIVEECPPFPKPALEQLL
jgi:hypothetical protein